jgi:prepilin-type N-terminal cleavage/methylation domain-containing protein
MRIRRFSVALSRVQLRRNAFTMVEVLIAMGVVGILIVALYTAIAGSASMVRNCQDNERVTQILSDKLDTIRLYNWTQIQSGTFIPTNFVLGIDPAVTNSTPYYTGTVSLVQQPVSESYGANMVQVTVSVNWVSGSRPQQRSMTTYVAKYGLQTYIVR